MRDCNVVTMGGKSNNDVINGYSMVVLMVTVIVLVTVMVVILKEMY